MAEKSTILIIEDDRDLVEAMKITLKTNNYKVLTSYEPEKGFKLAKEKKPDLIILDVMFGNTEKTEGFDYALKIRQNKKISHTPILMSTSVNKEFPNMNFSPETDNEFLPVDDFINKPVQPNDLLQCVKKLLEMKRSKWADWPGKKK